MTCVPRMSTRRAGQVWNRVALGAVMAALLHPVAAQAQVNSQVVGQAIANTCQRPPDPATQAVVAGVVADSVTGVVLPNVGVTLDWKPTPDSLPAGRSATTNTNGLYVFCDVPAGVIARLEAHGHVTRAPITWQIEAGQLYVQNILLPLTSADSKGILIGLVIDADTRRPVTDAEVRLEERKQATSTNSRGYFTFGEQPYGIYTLQVKRLGYADYSAPVRVAGDLQQSVEVRISKKALQLEGLTVTARATRRRVDMDGLVRRMNLGFGTFITANELDRRPMARITDLLQGTAGVSVYQNRREHTFYLEVRGRNCVPDMFIDGIRYSGPPDELLFPPAEDLEAVEVYKGMEIPGIFMRAGTPQCAVIAMWRRTTPRTGGRTAGRKQVP